MFASCFDSPRTVRRSLAAAALVLAALAAPGGWLAAQTESVDGSAAPIGRPLPTPRPVPGSTPLTLDTSALRSPSVIAGRSIDIPIDITCRDGASTVALSATVNPVGPLLTLVPNRLTTPGRTLLTFATTTTTPSGSYFVKIAAQVVAGACNSNTVGFSVDVRRPVRLEVDPASISTPPGGMAIYDVTLRRTNFTGAVTLRTSGLPASFDSGFVPPVPTGTVSRLTVGVPNPTNECPPPNGCRFKIRGEAAGGVQVDAAEAQLIVQGGVKFTATPMSSQAQAGAAVRVEIGIVRSGFAGEVGLILVGPGGVMAAIDPPIPTLGNAYRLDLTLPAGVVGRFQFIATPEVPAEVAATPVTFEIQVDLDFSVSIRATPLTQAVVQGQPGFLDLSITKVNVGPVTFIGVLGLPSGTVAVPDRTLDPTRVTLVTGPLTPPGLYPLAIQAQYVDPNGLQPFVQSNPVTLEVLSVVTPSVQLSADPPSLTLTSGQAGTSTIVATRSNCNGTITPTRPATLPPEITDLTFRSLGSDRFEARVVAGTVSADRTVWLAIGAQVSGCSGVQVQGTPLTVAVRPVAVDLPTINGFSPTSGLANTQVQIFGSGFTGVQNVLFTGPNGGVGAAFSVISPNQVNATVPGLAASGPIRVVTSQGTATSAGSFLVAGSSQAPQVSGFSPASGPAGTSVRIDGANFTNVSDVSLGTAGVGFQPLAFTVANPSRIDVSIPASGATGFFRVTTANGVAQSATAFQVTTPNLPQIGGFDPISGPAGTRVQINGANLGSATQVTFNGTPAGFEPPEPGRLFATVPVGATTGPIRVTTPVATAVSFMPFAVSSGAPVITGFQPLSGRQGDSITLAGVNFLGVSEVTFNGQRATLGIVTNNFVQAFVPAGASSGPVRLTTPLGTATGSAPFIVLP